MSVSISHDAWKSGTHLDHHGLVGVLDIGSNSVRLVVFEGDGRMPIPLFNEKALCGLGTGLQETGHLSEQGVRSALENLERYFTIAKGMGVQEVSVLATAAVRDARNGDEFVSAIEERFGHRVMVLSGDEEARLSALGVISAFPQADGVVGDLGGGSLELVDVQNGQARRFETTPLGPLRLGELTRQNRDELTARIDTILRKVSWLDALEGRDLFAVGGAWRSLARAHMELTDYPLEVIHHYAIGADETVRFLEEIARMGRKELRALDAVSKRRVDKLPVTALVLKRTIELGKARQVVFSSFGLREGCLYDRLPQGEQARDPLVDSCMDIAYKSSRFSPHPEVLERWIAPFFEDVPASEQRLIRAACALSDFAWNEHPSYRGEHAFQRVLRLPVVGLNHADRVFLAYAILARYTGGIDEEGTQRVRKLLSLRRRDLALNVGLALRLALTLSGGATELLESALLERERDMVGERGFVISMHGHQGGLAGDVVTRRIAALSEALGQDIRIER
ncbi:Ppx/GppA family phosphatase [Nisaea acidiphila]|uniref:Ppx/GppA family phosphatase n=1 Tax=Nisaea acidiphila TaxID=1862145 RepID=A0A9J7AUB2_9PROT|nr:Ppx/GppA family phosphatase [Nisaea acidiphila]UUX50936.1 Ppx/GppA family phosphatase [Nisaea acidiphila]